MRKLLHLKNLAIISQKDQNKVLAKNIVVGIFIASPLKAAIGLVQITAGIFVGVVSWLIGGLFNILFKDSGVAEYGLSYRLRNSDRCWIFIWKRF